MRIWRNSPADAVLLGVSVAQFATTLWLLSRWDEAGVVGRLVGFALLPLMTAYNIIVVSHLFTHAPWFTSSRLNALVSVLNSVNIGQSVQAYQMSHVRNHHRFNNDAKDEEGNTKDTSSTYRDGEDGEHTPLVRYAVGGAVGSLLARGREFASVVRLWRVGAPERQLLDLAPRNPERRARELRQVRFDRAAHCLSLVAYAVVSWEWTLLCYLPTFFIALVMVNVQNYYRHYGANPDSRTADSVSHYGRLYNLLTFNDGYHQEHHLSPSSHWSKMPAVRERHRGQLDVEPRIVSPVPAMLGFLHRDRDLLHRTGAGR